MATPRKVTTPDIGNAYLQALLDARAAGMGITRAGAEQLRRAMAGAINSITAELQNATNTMSAERANELQRQLRAMFLQVDRDLGKRTRANNVLTVERVVSIHRATLAGLFQAYTNIPQAGARTLLNVVQARALATLSARRGLSSTYSTSLLGGATGPMNGIVPAVDKLLGSAVARGVSVATVGRDLSRLLIDDDPETRPLVRVLRGRGGSIGRLTDGELQNTYGLDPKAATKVRAYYQRARLIAATEPLNALREANAQSLSASPIVLAAKWSLSGNHPDYDSCDVMATSDFYGYGPGYYAPEHWPFTHPRCRCYQGGPVKYRPPGEWGQPKPPINSPLADPVHLDPADKVSEKALARARRYATQLARQARLEDLEKQKRKPRPPKPTPQVAPVVPPVVAPPVPKPVAPPAPPVPANQGSAGTLHPPGRPSVRALSPQEWARLTPAEAKAASGWTDIPSGLSLADAEAAIQAKFKSHFNVRGVDFKGNGSPPQSQWGRGFSVDPAAARLAWANQVGAMWAELQVRFPSMDPAPYAVAHATSVGRGRSHLGTHPAGIRELAVSDHSDFSRQNAAAWEKAHNRKRGCREDEELGSVDTLEDHRRAVFRHELGHALTTRHVFGEWDAMVAELQRNGELNPPPRTKTVLGPNSMFRNADPLKMNPRARWFQTRVSEYAGSNDAKIPLHKVAEEIAEAFRMVSKRDYKLGTLPRAMERFIFKNMLGEKHPLE